MGEASISLGKGVDARIAVPVISEGRLLIIPHHPSRQGASQRYQDNHGNDKISEFFIFILSGKSCIGEIFDYCITDSLGKMFQ